MKLMKGKITKKLLSVALSLMMVMTFFQAHVVPVYADSTTSISDEVATKIKNANTTSTYDSTKLNTLYGVGEANLTLNDEIDVNGVKCYVLSVDATNNTAQLITKNIYSQKFNYVYNKYDYATSELKTYMDNFYTYKLGSDSRIIAQDVYSYRQDSFDCLEWENDFSTFTIAELTGTNYVYALDAVEATTNASKFGSSSWYDYNAYRDSAYTDNCSGFWISAGCNDTECGEISAFSVDCDGDIYYNSVIDGCIGARPAFTIDLTVSSSTPAPTCSVAIMSGTQLWDAGKPESGSTATDAVKAHIHANGTLHIFGSGEMQNYPTANAPWNSNNSSITTIVVDDGVTTIGDQAFRGCSNATSVTISDSVTEIRSNAFNRCSSLTSIAIPNTVTFIGDYAFYACTGLTNITIPASVTSIRYEVLSGCTNITNVTLEGTVRATGSEIDGSGIGSSSFGGVGTSGGSNNPTITFSSTWTGDRQNSSTGAYKGGYFAITPTSTTYTVTFHANGGTGTQTAATEISGTYTLPTTTTFTAPEGKTFDGWSTTEGGTKISITTIEVSANTDLYVVWKNNSTPAQTCSVAIMSETQLWDAGKPESGSTATDAVKAHIHADGTLHIFGSGEMSSFAIASDSPWYSKRDSITTVVIGNGVTSIGNRAFKDCTNLVNLTISSSVTSIGTYAFHQCAKLSGITVPISVTSIESYAFWGCKAIENVTFQGTVGTNGSGIGTWIFKGVGTNGGSSNPTITFPSTWTDNKQNATTGEFKAGYFAITPTSTTYTVTFHANGGTGTQNAATEISGTYTLPTTTTFTAPEGKTFDGWSTTEGGTKISTTTIDVSANTDLYVVWKNSSAAYNWSQMTRFTASITLDNDDMPTEQVTSALPSTYTPSNYDRVIFGKQEGSYRCIWWNSGSWSYYGSVSLDTYIPWINNNQNVYVIGTVTDVTYHWSQVTANTTEITLDNNSLSQATALSFINANYASNNSYNGCYCIYAYNSANSSYCATSLFYNSSSSSYIGMGTTDMTDSDIKTYLSSSDIYVIGTVAESSGSTTYTVTFHANGGTGTQTAATEISGTYTLPTTTTFTAPEGKTFDGWSTTEGGTKISTTTIEVSANTDLYAVWVVAAPITPAHTHEFATSWSYDATNHWHACTADGNSDSCLTETLAAKAAHLGGTATCQAKAACTTCGQSYGDYGAHNWGAWDATTGTRRCTTAGCTETQTCDHNGQTEAICSICGKILRCLHTERTYVAKIASTCIEHGTDAYWRCDSCGEKFSTQTGDTHITDESVLELPFGSHSRRTSPAYAATCTELGKTRGVYCIVCGEVFETEIYTPSFGHDFGEEYVIDKAPTCLEEGIKSLYCSRCGERTNITTIPVTGHSEVAIGTAKAATCLEEGLTAGSKCSVCGVIIEEQKVIPKTGHAYSEEYTIDVEPTCTKEGSKSRHCTTEGCTAKTDVTVVEKAAHTEVAIGTAKAATCLEEGLTAGSKCSVCGEIIEEQKVVPVTDHNYSSEYTVDKEPTCSEEGSKSRYCTTEGCTANTDVTAIAKIAHTETEFGTRVEPTCIATGLTTGIKCSVCGEIIKEQQTVAMINHNYTSEYTVDKEATCTEEGSKSRHCTTEGCTAKTDVTVIEKIAHTEVTNKAIKESCTKDGLTEGKHCSICGTIIVAQNTIPATGHTYSESWTVVKEATATEEGRKETSCVNGCGTKKYASIPATGVKEDASTKGDLDKGIEVADDAPVESASFDNTKSELLEASGLFTEEEKEDIKNGIDAKIYLVIEKVEEDEVPVEEQNMVSSATSEELGEDAIIDYIDISLFKQVGDNEAEKVHEPGTEIKVTLEIPEEMLITEKGEVRKYRIVKIHNGKIEVIKGRFNPETNEFSFSTDEFSTYALVYSDEKMEIVINIPEIPGGNGDGTPVIKKGDEIKIDVKVTPEDDAPQDITITSSNPSVVEVDPDGTIKGVGIGSSIITIKTIDGTVEKELKITVDEEVKDDNPGTDGDNSGTNGNTDTVNDNPDKNSGTSGTSNSTDDTNNGNAGTDTNGGHKCTLFTWCSCFCWCMVLRFILIALIVAAGVYFGLKAKKKDKKEKK